MLARLGLRISFWVGVLGGLASLAVHLATFTAAPIPPAAWVLHLGIFIAFVPVVYALFESVGARDIQPFDFQRQLAIQRSILRVLEPWQRVALGVLFVYMAVNFATGAAPAIRDGGEINDYRIFSGHWLGFYTISAVFAHQLSRRKVPGAIAEGEAPEATREIAP